MIQELLVGLIFTGALFYVGRLVYKSFHKKSASSCATGCGKCGVVDFQKMEEQIRMEGRGNQ